MKQTIDYTILLTLSAQLEENCSSWEIIKTIRRLVRDKSGIELQDFRLALERLQINSYIETNVSIAGNPIFNVTPKGKELLDILNT